MNDDIAIGIDAGTSNSVIGVFKKNKVEIIPNSIGDSCTPSIVQFLDQGVSVGEEIMFHKIDIKNSKNLITEIKRIVGRTYSSLTSQEKEKYDIIEDPKAKDQILIKVIRKGKEETFSPEMILSLIFKRLIKFASDFLGTSISKAVITIPAYFDYNQRGAIVESAKMAGIEVMRIITEPTAAALAYGLGTLENLKNSLYVSYMQMDNKINRKILVFDLGGGTFDVSILDLKNNKEFSVIATSGNNHLGGDDFDNKLVDFCIKKFCSINTEIDEKEIKKDKYILRRLKNQCEKAKKKLSYMNEIFIKIYNMYKDNNLYVEIKRQEFDEICEDLYQKIKSVLDKVLSESKLSMKEIDDILLVGGSSRIPKIKELLVEKFGTGKIRDDINPDEAVAIGAAWQAHKIMKSSLNFSILDITPFSLGVATRSKIEEEVKIGSIMSFLIEKSQKIPCKSDEKLYYSVIDNQPYFLIKLYAGEKKYCKDNDLLTEFKIGELPKGKKGSVSLKLSLEIDLNGILFINAEVESIGRKVTEKYSFYQKKENETQISVRIKNNENLEKIRDTVEIIKKKEIQLEKSQNDEEKIKLLKILEENCSELIKIYDSLSLNNDSDNIYQKLFKYYKKILKYYSQMILIENNNNDIIDKIKAILSKFIDDDIEGLVNVLNNLREKKTNEYCIIIIYSADILYQEGEKILNEGKKYCRYYSRKFFIKGDRIKSKINENMIENARPGVRNLYKKLNEKYINRVGQIDAFTKSLQSFIEDRNTPYINTGFTFIRKIIDEYMEPENIDLALDIFSEMAESLSKDKKNPTESEAYCLFNIIYIKFEILNNQDLNNINVYEKLIGRIEYILDNIEFDKEPKWVSQYNELKKNILTKKEEELNKIEEQNLRKYKPHIEQLKELYANRMKEKKPMEFLDYIINNYPFIGKDELEDDLKTKVFENKFKTIFPKYHPDNYKGRDDHCIYYQIYLLLVNMEEKLFKKK